MHKFAVVTAAVETEARAGIPNPERPLSGSSVWLFALASCFCLHWQAFTARPDSTLVDADTQQILVGYRQAPNLLHDGLRWWHGNWINTGPPALRPVSSYWHWFQCYLCLHYGWQWAIITAFALLVAICVALGCLARVWTGNDLVAIAAALLMASFQSSLYYYRSPVCWPLDPLTWLPVGDNQVGILFSLLALRSFLKWQGTAKVIDYLAAVGFMVLAAFSKEWAYILPLMFVVLSLFKTESQKTRRCLMGSVACLLFVGALDAYRESLFHQARGSVPSPFSLLYLVQGLADTWRVSPMYGLFYLWDHWIPIEVAALVGLAILAWRGRGQNSVLSATLLLALSFIPLRGCDWTGHRLYFVWPFMALLVCAVMQEAGERYDRLRLSWGRALNHVSLRLLKKVTTRN